ncbi:MAG: ABC transporter substrate-binding protein [Cocleimonas sp.]
MKILNTKSLKTIAAACCLSLTAVTSSAIAADSTKPIVIPIHNWSSQIVSAHVLGEMFKSMGNNVEFVPADTQAVYESIRNGDVTLSHEVWESTFGKSFYNAMAKGGVIDAGTHAATTLEEMGVPTWVVEKGLCPGLPNWEALKEEACYKNFVTADSGGKGRWLEGPQSWHGDLMPERLKALGLDKNWTIKFAGSADSLWTELASAKKEQRGTVVFNWTPNFTDAEGYTFIKFPEYKPNCRIKDGGDGKCGSPVGWLKKAANYKFPKTHPAAYTAFSKVSFTTKQVGEMAALVDIDKMDHKDAGKKWFEDNKETVMSWTK